jgi:O-antigen/teichoic acid export membrane protein
MDEGARAFNAVLEDQPLEQEHSSVARDALTRNVGIDLIARAGYLLSRIFIPPFVLARLDLATYSLWSAVFLVVSYVGMTSFGFSSAYVRYVAEYAGRGETNRANSILSTGLVLSSVVCMLFLGLLTLGMPQVVSWLNVPPNLQHDARQVILVVVGVHALGIALSVFSASLVGSQKVAHAQAIWIVSYVSEAALIFILVGTGHGLWGLAEAFVIRELIALGLSALVAYQLVPWLSISPWRCTRKSFRELINFGGVIQFDSILVTALNTFERLIAAPLIGLEAVGLLDIGDKLPNMAGSIPSAFANSFLPAAAYLQGGLAGTSQGRETIAKLYLKGARYMTLAASSLTGVLAMASTPLLTVWMGRIYPGTAFLMTIFAIQQHAHLMTGPGTSILRGIGRPWAEFVYTVPNFIALAVTLPLSRLILGRWSAVGLGSAVVVATLISAATFIVHANRVFQVPWRRYLKLVVMPSLVPYLIGGLCAWPVWTLVVHTGRWHGVVIMAAVVLVYALLLLIVIDRFILQPDERQWFRAVMRREFDAISGSLAFRPRRGNLPQRP